MTSLYRNIIYYYSEATEKCMERYVGAREGSRWSAPIHRRQEGLMVRLIKISAAASIVILSFLVIFLFSPCRNHHAPLWADGNISSGEASYRNELIHMLELLYRTSNINVIKGLSFSASQLEKLQQLAAEAEKQIPRFSFSGTLSPDVAAVDRAYSSLADSLLADGSVSAELKQEVAAARAREAAMIKDSLAYDRSMTSGECLRCHVPKERRKSAGNWEKALAADPEKIRSEQGYAHFSGVIGKKGLTVLAGKSREVDAILSDNQKVLLDDFSCCLIPPEDLNNPVRIGQVEVSVNDIKILDAARSVPQASWPQIRDRITEKMAYGQFLRRPEITAKEKEDYRKRAAMVLDKARSLSPEDFALEKEALVSEMKQQKKNQTPEKIRLIKQAFFLLLPGSSNVYEHVRKSSPR